jgi:hypothetical protein
VTQLELEMLGGSAERLMRRRRGAIDDLPWGSLAGAAISESDRAAARLVWTDSAFREYASAASFAALSTALLEAGAPIDLAAMCSDFVVDEMTHVELAARLACELGGAAPYHVDLARVSPLATGDPPIERAAELALLTCVGEVLSVPSIAGALRATDQPLVRAVLARIVRDERPHARLGPRRRSRRVRRDLRSLPSRRARDRPRARAVERRRRRGAGRLPRRLAAPGGARGTGRVSGLAHVDRAPSRVTSGAVELVTGRAVAYVPRGASSRIVAGRGPGTPAMNGASAELRAAIDRFDAGDRSAIDRIASVATAGDTLTLWNLLARTDLDRRARTAIVDSLDRVAPSVVDRERALAGDREELERLKDRLRDRWLRAG